jgi:hypothetical protein
MDHVITITYAVQVAVMSKSLNMLILVFIAMFNPA